MHFLGVLVALASLVPVTAPSAAAKPTYLIQLNFEDGQTIQADSKDHLELELNMNIEVADEGRKNRQSQTIGLFTTATQSFSEKILEALNGRAKKIRRAYQIYDVTSKSVPPSLRRPGADETLLTGATLLFTLNPEGRTTVKQEGTPHPQLGSVLKHLESLSEMYAPLLPTRPVRLGDTWELDPLYLKRLPHKLKKMVGGLLQESGEPKLTDASVGAICQLLRVRNTSDEPIGTIEVTSLVKASYRGKIDAKSDGTEEARNPTPTMNTHITMTMKGKTLLEIHLVSGHLISDTSTGTIELTMIAETEKSDEPIQMTIHAEANGPIESHATFTYSKK